MKNVNDFSSFLNEMDINDPILINSRASRDKASRDKAELKKRLAKRVYGKKREEIENEIWEINLELKDLYREEREAFGEQDAEAGQKGQDWSDDDANRYGKIFNEIHDKIEELLVKREKLEAKLAW